MKATVAGVLAGSPWAPRQAGAFTALQVGASLLLVVAWRTSAKQAALGDEIPWLNLGVAAVVVAGAADVTWLAQGRHALLVRRRSIIADLSDVLPSVAIQPVVAGTTGWIAIEGGSRAHRPGCLLVDGKPAVPVDPRALRQAGRHLRRCEVCAQ